MMGAMNIIFATVALAIVVQISVWYAKETGTVWQRLLAACRDSATWLWGKVLLLFSGVTENLENIANALNLPEVVTWFKTNIGDPHTLATIFAGIAIITLASRARTIGKTA